VVWSRRKLGPLRSGCRRRGRRPMWTYRALHGSAPLTWRRHSHMSPTCRTDAGSGPPPLNSLTFRPVVGQLSEVVPFLLLEQRCGMAWQAKLRRPRRCRWSRTGWRHLFRRCYETVWLSITFPFPSHYLPPQNSGPCNSFYCLGHSKNVYDDDDDDDSRWNEHVCYATQKLASGPRYARWSDVTESTATIRSPFCGYNVA